MNREELIGKLQMVYVGDKNALNELIGYYDGLKEVVELLKKENQKYKEVIDKLKTNIENDIDGFITINEFGESNEILELLDIYSDILKEVSK